MCCNSSSTQSQTTTSNLPEWLSNAGQHIWNRARSVSEMPYAAPPFPTVPPMNDTQVRSINAAERAHNNRLNSTRPSAADQMFRAFAGAPAQQIDGQYFLNNRSRLDVDRLGRPVDPGAQVAGVLDARGGDPFRSAESYMSPFLQGVLSPTLDRIREQGVLERGQIDAAATGSNAFGDARHGALEAEQRRNESRQVADTTTQIMAGGYDRGASQRQQEIDRFVAGLTGDVGRRVSTGEAAAARYLTGAQADANLGEASLSRFYGAQDANARLRESALQRMLQGGGALSDLDTRDISHAASIQNMLAGAGNLIYNQNDRAIQDDIRRFSEARGHPQDQLNTLVSAIRGVPYDRTQTSTSTVPNNAGSSALGSLIGVGGRALLGF